MIGRAHKLLLAGEGAFDHAIASALHVQRTREHFWEAAPAGALYAGSRPGAEPKLAGKGEAFLAALACTEAPGGREHWTMQLLADKGSSYRRVRWNLVERMINRLKQFRRVATRYDKLAVRYHAFAVLAAIHLWLAA